MKRGITASVNEFVVLNGIVAKWAHAASGPIAK
jgi:hypothetical protein